MTITYRSDDDGTAGILWADLPNEFGSDDGAEAPALNKDAIRLLVEIRDLCNKFLETVQGTTGEFLEEPEEDDCYYQDDYEDDYPDHEDEDFERLMISERISMQDAYYERTGGQEWDYDSFPKYDEDNGCWLDRDDWESNCM